MVPEIETQASVMVGVLVPLVVQLVKMKLVPVAGKAAQLVALGVAGLSIGGAHLARSLPITMNCLVQDIGFAFALSQLVHRQLVDTPVDRYLVPGR